MRWTVSKKLAVGFGGIMVVVAISTAIAFTNLQSLITHQNRTLFRSTVLKTTYEMLATGNFGNATIRNYYISMQDPVQGPRTRNVLAGTWEKMDKLNAALKEKVPSLNSDEHKRMAGEIISHATAWKNEQIDAVQQLERGGEVQSKMAETIKKNSFLWPNQFRSDISTFLDALNKQDAEESEAAAKKAETATWTAILSAALVLGFGVCLILFLNKRIASPLREAARRITEAEADNDLTTRVVASSDDEVGDICTAFNSFVQKLHGAVSQAASTAEQVVSASEEIAASAGQASAGADSQQQHAMQAATAMHEMTATVHQVAEHSNTAAEAAHNAAEAARNGGIVVEASLASKRSITGAVSDTASKIAELGKSSDQIGLIVNVIEDIADQTNLLALNAAIEAARAGEQGRGFAVVADEVRKLAERTAKATQEIAQMITSIQGETKRAIDTMEAGTKQVQHGVEQTAQAGESLQEIIRAAEKVGDMISQIATATTEQSATTTEISTNVEQIAKITKESLSGAQQSARACQDLSGLALDLQKLVSQFRLGEGKHGGAAGTRPQEMRGGRLQTGAHAELEFAGHGRLDEYEVNAAVQ